MYSGFETETKPSNLKPFQFPIPEGFEVVTRSGEKVTQLTKFDIATDYDIAAVINGYIETFTSDGIHYREEISENDLFLRPIPRERWVVVVERNGSNWVAAIEESEKNAESTQQQSQTIYPTATVSIHKITLP